jgi:hypothetical protein
MKIVDHTTLGFGFWVSRGGDALKSGNEQHHVADMMDGREAGLGLSLHIVSACYYETHCGTGIAVTH